MPTLRPLRGLGYALERFAVPAPPGMRTADVTSVVCPPYDVISPAQQAALLARDPHNAVRLELSAEVDPHTGAAASLAAWQADGTLERRAEGSVYYYRHARPAAPDEPSVQGVLARLLLEPFGAGVRAHEHTMAGPKADRLALLRASRTQLSPILAIYFDRSARYDHVMGRPWTDAPPGSLAADWIMIVLVNAEREELEILATHRLVLKADDEALRSLVSDQSPMWEALPVTPGELGSRLAAMEGDARAAFGLVLPGDQGYLLVGDADAVTERMARERTSTAVRGLDLAVLHAAVLADRLGISAADLATGGRLAYTRSEADAIRAVASGEAKAAILVRPTRLEQLAAVASAGDVMPQKSTYFYPKLLTGLVFYPLEGD